MIYFITYTMEHRILCYKRLKGRVVMPIDEYFSLQHVVQTRNGGNRLEVSLSSKTYRLKMIFNAV